MSSTFKKYFLSTEAALDVISTAYWFHGGDSKEGKFIARLGALLAEFGIDAALTPEEYHRLVSLARKP